MNKKTNGKGLFFEKSKMKIANPAVNSERAELQKLKQKERSKTIYANNC